MSKPLAISRASATSTGSGSAGGLLLHGAHHRGVGVAHACHGDAGAEVDQRVAVGVHHHATARGDGGDGGGVTHARGDRGRLALKQLGGARAGDLGDEQSLLRQGGAARGDRGDGDGVGHDSEPIQ